MRRVDSAVVPRGIQTAQVVGVAVAQEEAVLSQIIFHELKVVYSYVRMQNMTHLTILCFIPTIYFGGLFLIYSKFEFNFKKLEVI